MATIKFDLYFINPGRYFSPLVRFPLFHSIAFLEMKVWKFLSDVCNCNFQNWIQCRIQRVHSSECHTRVQWESLPRRSLALNEEKKKHSFSEIDNYSFHRKAMWIWRNQDQSKAEIDKKASQISSKLIRYWILKRGVGSIHKRISLKTIQMHSNTKAQLWSLLACPLSPFFPPHSLLNFGIIKLDHCSLYINKENFSSAKYSQKELILSAN